MVFLNEHFKKFSINDDPDMPATLLKPEDDEDSKFTGWEWIHNMSARMLAEMAGTFVLVFLGCGAIVIPKEPTNICIALAFGLALLGMCYTIGNVSGCHINPAVSFAMFVCGRISTSTMMLYVAAQFVGGVAAAGALYCIVSGRPKYILAKDGLGCNGFGTGYRGEYPLESVFIAETVNTFFFCMVILGCTNASGLHQKVNRMDAGIAIGFICAAIHMAFIDVDGVSLNPARSLGPAVIVGGLKFKQVWVFVCAPLLGALFAGATYHPKLGFFTLKQEAQEQRIDYKNLAYTPQPTQLGGSVGPQ